MTIWTTRGAGNGETGSGPCVFVCCNVSNFVQMQYMLLAINGYRALCWRKFRLTLIYMPLYYDVDEKLNVKE